MVKQYGQTIYLIKLLENAFQVYRDFTLLRMYLDKFHPNGIKVDRKQREIFNVILELEKAVAITQDVAFDTYEKWIEATPSMMEISMKIFTEMGYIRYVLSLDNKIYPDDLKDYEHLASCDDH